MMFKSLHRIAWILIAIMLGVFAVLIPPFQKPDEEAHFIRALGIAHGGTTCVRANGNTVNAPREEFTLISKIHQYNLPLNPDHHIPGTAYRKIMSAPSDYRPYAFNIDTYCEFPILSYVPQSVGILVGEALHMNGFSIFYLGRIIMAVLAFIWLLCIYRIAPVRYRSILLLVFIIPMLLHQLTSYGYDGINLLLAFTLFSYALRLREQRMVKTIQGGFLFAISLLYLYSRTAGHELLIFMPLLLLYTHVQGKRWRSVVVFLAYFMLLLVPYVLLKNSSVHSYMHNGLPHGADPGYQLRYIITNPLNYLLMIIRTSGARGVFYMQSMVGIFGWLEYGIPHWLYAFWGCLCAGTILSWPHTPRERGERPFIAVLLLCAASYVYVVTIFYLVWTVNGASVADGVQGRYFLILMPWGLTALTVLKPRFIPVIRIPLIIQLLALLVGIGAVASITNTIYTRYYSSIPDTMYAHAVLHPTVPNSPPVHPE